MFDSRVSGTASGGAVAFGVALLFATGSVGFYRLAQVTRPGADYAPSVVWPVERHDEGHPPALVQTASEFPAAGNAAEVVPPPGETVEVPDFFPAPTAPFTGALPGR